MKRIFSVLFALTLAVSLWLAAASPVVADVSPGWTNIRQVAAGPASQHTVGLQSDGTVVAVGLNSFGQCDVGSWTDIVQVSAGGLHTVGLRSDGTVVAVGDNGHWQCNVGGWTNIIQVSAGGYHTVGLESDGTVVAVGYNGYGQRNVGDWANITQVSAGGYHTVGLDLDGTVIAVGDNEYGQCDVSGWASIDQVVAGLYHTVGLDLDDTVVAVGDNALGQCGHIVTERITGYGIVDAIAEADTEVEVHGTATVTIYKIDSTLHSLSGEGVPASPGLLVEEPYEKLNKDIVDVSATDIQPGTEFELRVWYTEAEAAGFKEGTLRLFWKSGDEWIRCSPDSENSGDEPASRIENGKHYVGYIWTQIKATGTSPTIGDLDGTEFGGYGHPAEIEDCGCFVATAAYGTNTARELDILREFRETVLLPNSLGAKFVSFYYRTSPPLAHFISQNEVLRTMARVTFVDPIARLLAWTHDLWSP